MAKSVSVTIFYQKGKDLCDASCGVDWSMPANRELAVARVWQRFATKVELEFVDLDQADTAGKHHELRNRIERENLLLPILKVGKSLKITGAFDIRMLCDMVETEIEGQEDIW